MKRHPTAEHLRAFALGVAVDADARGVVHHLLAGCDGCAERVAAAGELRFGAGDDGGGRSGTALLARLREDRRSVESESLAAESLWDEFRQQPAERAALLVANSDRFVSRAFCEVLCREAYARRSRDPRESSALAELAVTVAERLSRRGVPEALAADALARSLSIRGNALRLLSDHAAAQRCFERAEEALDRGSGDVSLAADLWTKRAALASDRGDYGRALRWTRRAVRRYRECGERRKALGATLNESVLLSYSERHDEAIRLQRGLLAEIDDGEDPSFAVRCRHNLMNALLRKGETDEVARLLEASGTLYDAVGDRSLLLRRRWLEGNLARRTGEVLSAERAYRDACRGFLDLGSPFLAAWACLDLAILLVEERRPSEAVELASAVYRVFESRVAHVPALAALGTLVRALEEGVATVEIVRSVGDRLRAIERSAPD